ncbi:complex I subunit 4 family protein [Melittangium boletus]|uniref:complex I subunit 4 family protein n=1 Tax=Melittangium boletus TaxID=83453 RepID=UPI003DA1F546
MSFFDTHLLNLVVYLPLLFAVLVALLPAGERGQIRAVTLIGMAVDLVLGIWAYARFEPSGSEFQLEYRVRWLDQLGASYHVGVDGLSISLVLLTVFLGPVVVLASSTSITERVKEFHLSLLLLQVAMMGALVSLDVLLFYVFWEAMLIPMYLLVGVWGGEDRQAAALKFFLYTLAGSLLMLVAIVALYFISSTPGTRSFDYASIYNSLVVANRDIAACVSAVGRDCTRLDGMGGILFRWGPWLFAAFALAFAIKVPLFPLHTWLPDAYVQAPAGASALLSGIMAKIGLYGFWRFAIPLFPAAAHQHRPVLATLAVVGIIYGALMCLAQRDVKKLIAYSSVSHLGYCMLGLVALTGEGASGSAYQMLNHGVSTGALFLLFGFLQERRHSRLMSDYGGIAKVVPVYTTAFLLLTFSSLAVPGTNGFVGEFLILLGTFKSGLGVAFGVLGTVGVILGAVYLLWMVQKVFFGPLTHRDNQALTDLNAREFVTVLPFLVLVVVMGLRPQPFLDRIHPATERFVARASLGVPGARPAGDVNITVKGLPPSAEAAAPLDPPAGALADRR